MPLCGEPLEQVPWIADFDSKITTRKIAAVWLSECNKNRVRSLAQGDLGN